MIITQIKQGFFKTLFLFMDSPKYLIFTIFSFLMSLSLMQILGTSVSSVTLLTILLSFGLLHKEASNNIESLTIDKFFNYVAHKRSDMLIFYIGIFLLFLVLDIINVDEVTKQTQSMSGIILFFTYIIGFISVFISLCSIVFYLTFSENNKSYFRTTYTIISENWKLLSGLSLVFIVLSMLHIHFLLSYSIMLYIIYFTLIDGSETLSKLKDENEYTW